MIERAKSGARAKKARGGRGEGEKEREGKVDATDNPLLKNLRGR